MNAMNTNTKRKITIPLLGYRMLTVCLMLLTTYLFAGKVWAQEYDGVAESDSLALVAFYEAANGDHWVEKGGWLVDRVDNWEGVDVENIGDEVNPEWRVVGLSQRRNMAQAGEIAPEIGNLIYLDDLQLRQQPMFGEIPPEIGNLENLTHIQFQSLEVSGEIPWDAFTGAEEGYAGLESIQRLRIYGNRLVGEIPSSIELFTEMQDFRLNSNQLEGNIPAEIATFEFLESLRIDGNKFTGDLPDLGHLEFLDQIDINDNPLDPGPIWDWLGDGNLPETLTELHFQNTNRTGSVPAWFGDLFALERLTLGEIDPRLENALGGDFPEELEQLINLQRPTIYGINFTGPLPDWLGEVQRLGLHNCGFSGTIPGSFANIEQDMIITNCPNLEGTFPDEFQNFQGRRLVWENTPLDHYWGPPGPYVEEEMAWIEEFYGNPQAEFGELPEWIGNWALSHQLELAGVGVTGTIPAGLEDNLPVTTLNLSNNPGLVGEIPQYFANYAWKRLRLSYTGLEVNELPAWLNTDENKAAAENIELAGLGMEGELPAWLGEFYNVWGLDLSDNNFSGSIPSELGDLFAIVQLGLANNQLSGELPGSLAELGYFEGTWILRNLDLSGNEGLTGPLPEAWASNLDMRVLRYNDTGLWAPDDPTFIDWIDNVIPGNVHATDPPQFADVQTNGQVGEPVNVEDDLVGTPHRFHLGTNYPNPFNPTTNISYEIPVEGHVTLTVYNMIGQKVATLVNDVQSPGSHEVTFEGRSLASGTYLYRLKSGNRVMTRSMMLIK